MFFYGEVVVDVIAEASTVIDFSSESVFSRKETVFFISGSEVPAIWKSACRWPGNIISINSWKSILPSRLMSASCEKGKKYRDCQNNWDKMQRKIHYAKSKAISNSWQLGWVFSELLGNVVMGQSQEFGIWDFKRRKGPKKAKKCSTRVVPITSSF